MFLSRTPSFFLPPRPGRIRSALPQDSMRRQSFGDNVFHKDDLHTRVFFQNTNGLTPSSSCKYFKYCLNSLHSLQTDIVCLSETNLPWLQASHLQADFRAC